MALSINLKTIKSYIDNAQNAGAFVIKESRGGTDIKEAGFLHKVKSFFGFSSATRANSNTIDAIRDAIQRDSKLFAVAEDAQNLLKNVKGTITTEKLRSILDTLDERVDTMDASVYKEKAQSAIMGHLAGRTKLFSNSFNFENSGVNFDRDADFKRWYVRTITAHVSSTISTGGKNLNARSLTAACDEEIKKLNDCFRECFSALKVESHFADKDEGSRVKKFAKMCMEGNALVTHSDGSLNYDATLSNAKKLTVQLLFTDRMTSVGGKDFMDWYNKTANDCVRDGNGKVPGNWQDSFNGRTEFDKFFGKCLDVFGGDQNHIKTFVEMCMTGKMLAITKDGTVDQEQTLANATRLNEEFKLPDKMKAFGLDKNQKFMDWYNDVATMYCRGKQAQAPGSGKDALLEINQFFGKCLEVFDGKQNRINAFAKKCVAGEILATTPKGDLDLYKTMQNVKSLNYQFGYADRIGSRATHSPERVATMSKYQLGDDQKFVEWYNFASAVYVHSNMGKEMKSFDELCRDFDQFFGKCLDLFDGNKSHINVFAIMCKDGEMLAITPDLGFDKDKTMENVQRFVQQSKEQVVNEE